MVPCTGVRCSREEVGFGTCKKRGGTDFGDKFLFVSDPAAAVDKEDLNWMERDSTGAWSVCEHKKSNFFFSLASFFWEKSVCETAKLFFHVKGFLPVLTRSCDSTMRRRTMAREKPMRPMNRRSFSFILGCGDGLKEEKKINACQSHLIKS